MKLRVLSDLHLEVSRWDDPPAADADVVVLAGDIDNGARGLEWGLAHFSQPLLYVEGNHESYDGDFDQTAGLLAQAASGTRATCLDCGETRIDGVRFLGCALWTDYSLAGLDVRPMVIEASRRRNPDHQKIRRGTRLFQPEDAIEIHARHIAWLEAKLDEPFAGRTVVITHFAPHPNSIAPAFRDHPANPGFIIDLERLMGRAALWIHGHTHTRFDYRVNGTRVVSNPRGYPKEVTGFVPDWVVEV